MELNFLNRFLLIFLFIIFSLEGISAQSSFDKTYSGRYNITSILEDINKNYIIAFPYGLNNDITYKLIDTLGNVITDNDIINDKGIDFIELGKISNRLPTFIGRSYTNDPLDSSSLLIKGFLVTLNENYESKELIMALPDSASINNFWDFFEYDDGVKYFAIRSMFKNEPFSFNRIAAINKDGSFKCVNKEARYRCNSPSSICRFGINKVIIGLPIDSLFNSQTGDSYQKYGLIAYDNNCNFLFERHFEDSTLIYGNKVEVLDLEVLSDKSIF